MDIFITKDTVSVDGDEPTAYSLSPYYQEKLLKEGRLPDSELIAYGFELFHSIFATAKRRERITLILEELKDQHSLNITIKSNDPQLHSLPFEIINNDRTETGFLLKRGNISILRDIPALDKKILPAQLPIRILTLLSLPLETYEEHPIDPLRELQTIYTALDDYLRKGLVQIDIEEKVNLPTVRKRLLRGHYHIVHFIGHGAGGGLLAIEDEKDNEREKRLTSDELKRLFEGANVALFYFNACETAKPSPYAPSLAYNIFQNIDSAMVIANLAPVRDDLATQTTRLIYQRVFKEETIENVLNDARLMLNIDWWKPVVFGKAGKGGFDLKGEAEKREKAKKVIYRPPMTIKNYVYRYGIVRQASDLIGGDQNHLVLHGIGGAGKSTLAAYLAEFFEGRFKHIIFIDLRAEHIDTPEALVERLLEEFKREEIISKEELEGKDFIKKWRILNEKIATPWLFILDNLESIQDEKGVIRDRYQRFLSEILNTKTAFTILTSRLKPYLSTRQPLENTLEIGEYSDGEVGFLYQGLDKKEKAFFKENLPFIVALYGYHPLSLSAVIEKRGISLDKVFGTGELREVLEFYRPYFESNRKETERLFSLEYPFSKTLLNHLFEAGFISLLTERLLILKRLADHYLPYQVIKSYFKGDFRAEGLTLLKDKLLHILGGDKEGLTPYDLMNILSIFTTYHQETMDRNIEEYLLKVFITLSQWEGLSEIVTENLLITFEESLKEIKKEDEDLAATYNNLASVYQARGEYARAIEYCEKALKIIESRLGKDHPDTATTYHNLAGVYHARGEYDIAIGYYEKALKIKETRLGKDHPHTAATYNNLASVYQAKGDYARAIEYYGKALKIVESRLGKDHPHTATTYNNLAMVYQAKGDYARAIEYYEQALKIRESRLGRDHPHTATTYNNLAVVYQAKGDYARAIEYYEKAIEIVESRLGKDHPDTAATYNNLAMVYQAKGDYARAMEYYEKAIGIVESRLGKDHPHTATTYNNLAVVYQAKGDYARAIEYYEKALKIRETRLGKDHTDTAATYNNLAMVYQARGDYARAIEYYEKALDIYRGRKDYEDLFATLPPLIDSSTRISPPDYPEIAGYIRDFLEVFDIFWDKDKRLAIGIIGFFIRNKTFERIGTEKVKKGFQDMVARTTLSPLYLQRFEWFLNLLGSLSSDFETEKEAL